MTTPTIYLVIQGSCLAFTGKGEIIESVERESDGTPIWTNASICDHRGEGGAAGFTHLYTALFAAEANARSCGLDVVRVPDEELD